MAKKSIIEELIELAADFVGGYIIIMILMLPLAYMMYGWEGVAIIIFVVAIIGLCLLSGGNEDKSKPEIKNHKSRLKVKKVSSINSDYCNECHSYIEKGRKHCPHCLSKDITRWEMRKYDKKQDKYKSPLKVKKTSNKNKNWCNNCCTYIPKDKKYCPHCGSVDIKKN